MEVSNKKEEGNGDEGRGKEEGKSKNGEELGSGKKPEQEAKKAKSETANEKSENQEQYRVVINSDASECLEKMLAQVTHGFEAGTITKSDLANSVITKAIQSFGEADIKAIRQLHFDERKLLAAILKNSKDENQLPDPIKNAIREYFGMPSSIKKKVPKEAK
jgi:hypothetical protein